MSSEPYRQLFEHSPVAILTVNREGQIAECNRAAWTTLHRSREELRGAPVLKWVHPEDRERSKGHFLDAFNGIARSWSVMIQRGDGLLRRFDVAARLVDERDSGEVLTFLSPAVSEDRLPPELLRLWPLLQNLPGQFAAILDLDGRIRFSVGLARTHWQADAEWVGREFAHLLQGTDQMRESLAALTRETREARPWSGLLWHVRADGTPFPAETFAVASQDPRTHDVIGVLVAGRDASVEHEARRAREVAERLARVGEFVSGVTRELAAPLALAAERSAQLPEGAGVRAALEQAQGLLRALEGFSTDTAAADTATPLADALREAVAASSAEAGAATIELKAAADLPAVFVEPTALRRVFEELLRNAQEAVASSPLPRILVEAVRMPESVLVRIHDNGTGLPAQEPEKIFDPFTTTKAGHLGLGLPTARRIVEASGGRIWVERSQSGWTTMSLELSREPASGGVAFRPVPLVLSRARSLLVVEDDQGVRRMLVQLLERVGFRVAEAWSGRSALAHLTSGATFQTVLTDLRMGDGTGYWFLNELRKDFPELLPHTVIMTGDPSLAAVEKIARDTGCSVVRKPFEFRVLLEALDEAAGRGR